jgi:hypothetical protein
MCQDLARLLKDRLVELDDVVPEVEVGDRVGAEAGAEQQRIRPMAAGQRVAVAADQHIRAVAAEEDVVAGRAVEHALAVAAVQGRIGARLIACARIEEDEAQRRARRPAVPVRNCIAEGALRHDVFRQRGPIGDIAVAAVRREGERSVGPGDGLRAMPS